MTCDKYLDWMSLYIDGELEEKEQIIFENHMSNCSLCREELTLLQELIKDIKSLEMLEPPQSFHEDLMERLQSSQVIPLATKKNKWYLNLKIVSAVAAVFIFSVILINPLQINSPKESVIELEDNMAKSRMIEGPPGEPIADLKDAAPLPFAQESIAPDASLETWTIESVKYQQYIEAITGISQEMDLELNIDNDILEVVLESTKKAEFKSKLSQVDPRANIIIDQQDNQADQKQVKLVIIIKQIKE